MKFAKDCLHWTLKEWSKVLFSDKSKFCMFSKDGIKYMRHPKGKRFALSIKCQQLNMMVAAMVWGSFSHDSIGPLHRIKGIMGQNVFLDIIKNVMLPHGKDKMPHGWIFQQDNNPKQFGLLSCWKLGNSIFNLHYTCSNFIK